MEVVALVRAYGNEGSRHGEAVQVARDAAVHVGYLVLVEVVGGGEREVPPLGGTHRAGDAEVLRPLAVVVHLVVVEGAVAVVHRVVEREGPWEVPFGVSVGVGGVFLVLLAVLAAFHGRDFGEVLGSVVLLAVPVACVVVPDVVVLVGGVIAGLSAAAEGVVVEGI